MIEPSPIKRLIYSDQEVETERLEELAELPEFGDSGPGSFGCHEAFHMASYLQSQVAEQLLGHQSVIQNPEWFRAAHDAANALWHLYQMIGDAHLNRVNEDADTKPED